MQIGSENEENLSPFFIEIIVYLSLLTEDVADCALYQTSVYYASQALLLLRRQYRAALLFPPTPQPTHNHDVPHYGACLALSVLFLVAFSIGD